VDQAEKADQYPVAQEFLEQLVPPVPLSQPVPVGGQHPLRMHALPVQQQGVRRQGDPERAAEQVAQPEIVVARHVETAHARAGQRLKAGQHPQVTGGEHGLVLEIEIEQVSQDHQDIRPALHVLQEGGDPGGPVVRPAAVQVGVAEKNDPRLRRNRYFQIRGQVHFHRLHPGFVFSAGHIRQRQNSFSSRAGQLFSGYILKPVDVQCSKIFGARRPGMSGRLLQTP
jgi:hypothetical protein